MGPIVYVSVGELQLRPCLPVEPLWRDCAPVRLCGAPARLVRPQSVEHLAGVRLHESVRVGLVHGDIDRGRVQVVEID